MRAAVCDDNKIFLEEMKVILEKNKYIREVSLFSSPLELTLQVNGKTDFDLIFMDIDFGEEQEKNGLHWSEELYKKMSNIPIIFITGYNDRFAQHVLLTDANILGYMTKPVDLEVLDKYLQKAKEQKAEPKYLILSRQGGKISVDMNEIIHIESHNHKAIVFTESEQYIVYEKLADIEPRLSDDFIQCHKSFIVNMNWITTFEGKMLKMRTGKEIPISRTYGSNVREKFFDFLGTGI